MKRFFLTFAALVALLAACNVVCRWIPSYVEYHGQKIKLSRFYLDYDDYKNDPGNIAPSETARVQRLVSEAPIAHSFASRRAAVDAVFQVKFPGYGTGGFGGPIQQGDGALNGLEIEIPRSDNNRYFIFRNVHGRYVLVDDFIGSATSGISAVREENGSLVYYTASGQPKLVHPIMK